MDARLRCTATTAKGEPCGGVALAGESLCVFHHPDRRAKMAEGRRTGGHKSSNAERARSAMPQDVRDVSEMLLRCLAATEAGTMRPSTMTAIAAGARAYAELFKAGVMLSRVDRLESALDEDEAA